MRLPGDRETIGGWLGLGERSEQGAKLPSCY